MKHHIKLRHVGRYETDCGLMLKNKSEVTSSRMSTDCPECLDKIQENRVEAAVNKAYNEVIKSPDNGEEKA